MKRAAIALLLSTTPFLGGCVVWEIKNNLEQVNEQLGRVDAQLTAIDEQLQGVNEELVVLEKNLEPLPELNKLEELAAINDSIEPIEKHLASLRKTLANVSSTVPFLKLTDDTKESVEQEQAQPGSAEAQPAEPAPEDG